MDEEYGSGEKVTELVIPEGACIKQVILGTKWYTHQIGFITDKRVSIGPVGSLVGRSNSIYGNDWIDSIRIMPNSYVYKYCLYAIEGVTVETQAAPAITGLKFIFSSGHC